MRLQTRGLELEVINEEEAALLRRAEKGRLDTINVDDFDNEELVMQQPAPKPKRKPRATKAA